MGFPTTVSMNLVSFIDDVMILKANEILKQGMLVGWGILSPLAKNAGWAPGPVEDMTTGARGWILWTALAIMCADSVVSLLPVVIGYIIKLVWNPATRPSADRKDHEVETQDRLVPINWVIGGTIASVVIGVILVWIIFGGDGIKPWATFMGFVIGGMLSVLGLVTRCLHLYLPRSTHFHFN